MNVNKFLFIITCIMSDKYHLFIASKLFQNWDYFSFLQFFLKTKIHCYYSLLFYIHVCYVLFVDSCKRRKALIRHCLM